jgi:transposase-like protein
MYIPKTLQEAVKYYSDEQVCINAVAALRWDDGKPVCPKCGVVEGERKHYWLAAQKRWKCYACRKQFSVKVDSVFEDSALGLDKWLIALWMLCNCKNGISSHEIGRELGISQKSAWHLLHRLRYALHLPDDDLLTGTIEADETFIGGRVSNMHKSKRAKLGGKKRGVVGKAIVVGMLERNGRVKTQIVLERTKPVLNALMKKHIDKDATLVTDEWGGYVGTGLKHAVINHAEEYVRGQIHTQSIENFWALLKRSLGGTYISTEVFHLHRYLDEQCFRFNHRATKYRHFTNSDRFAIALSHIAGKKLTWKTLTGKEAGSTGDTTAPESGKA